MSDTKITALPVAASVAAGDQTVIAQSGTTKSLTYSLLRQTIGAGLSNFSSATVAAGYAADTYLAGSAVTLASAGAVRAGSLYVCTFDMVKTAAGVAAFTINFRMGTLGTTGDASIASLAFGAGTAAADTGSITVLALFRTVGAGSAAVVSIIAECNHHLAATGLISTGASGFGLVEAVSAGFNSTTQTIMGISVNGGAAFAGTNQFVSAYALAA